jgi:subtilisin family serine protease
MPRPTPQQQQIQLIVDAYTNPAVVKGPPNGEFTEYLYRSDAILVRDDYVARVRALGGVDPAETEGVVQGVQLVKLRQSVVTALRRIEAEFGPGVAAPDHVVSITGDCGGCPADEPEPVPPTYPLRPPLATDPSAGAGVRVVVVDTGFDSRAAAQHSWLAGVTGDPDPAIPTAGPILGTYAGHGTFIAGIVRAIAPAAEVIVRCAFTTVGTGFESMVISKLEDVLKDDYPDVISLSAGSWSYDATGLLAFDAFHRNRLSLHKGVALIAAAGNHGDRQSFWPAASPWTVSVGALDANAAGRASFSDFGSWVDVYAPGEALVNAFPAGIYEYTEGPKTGQQATFTGLARWSGTSFATPVVAGLVAARMSRTGENGQTAAAALLADARAAFRAGVGPVLLP